MSAIRKKIANIETAVPPPQSPSNDALKTFAKLMNGDMDNIPDSGKRSLSFCLTIATSVCSYTAYQLGVAKAIWMADKKNNEARAMVEYWQGLDKAYERYMQALSRHISLRKDAWDRERGSSR